MDLGTMQKKLNKLEYKSKQEFYDDLKLIYDNCLYYNSAPVRLLLSLGRKREEWCLIRMEMGCVCLAIDLPRARDCHEGKDRPLDGQGAQHHGARQDRSRQGCWHRVGRR